MSLLILASLAVIGCHFSAITTLILCHCHCYAISHAILLSVSITITSLPWYYTLLILFHWYAITKKEYIYMLWKIYGSSRWFQHTAFTMHHCWLIKLRHCFTPIRHAIDAAAFTFGHRFDIYASILLTPLHQPPCQYYHWCHSYLFDTGLLVITLNNIIGYRHYVIIWLLTYA